MLKLISRYRKLVPWLVLASLLVFLGHYFLPDKVRVIHPSANAKPIIFGFIDPASGMSSQWLNKLLSEWRCNYRPEHRYGCGYGVFWDEHYTQGIDIRGYQGIAFSVDYEGPDTAFVRFNIKNFNAAYAEYNNSVSNMPLTAILPASELRKGQVELALSEFSVASWWLKERDSRKRWLKPEFNNVTEIGIEFIEPGDYRMRVDSISLSGQWISSLQLAQLLLFFWMANFIAAGLFRFYLMYRTSLAGQERKRFYREEKKFLDIKNHTPQAYQDPLTGVLNRPGLEIKMAELSLQPKTYGMLGVLLLNLDDFKEVNNCYGHDTGDKVLKNLARVLAMNLQDNELFARLEGQEFILVSETENLQNLLERGEKIRRLVSHAPLAAADNLKLTVSIGMVAMRTEESIENSLVRAREALTRAKAAGKNRVEMNDARTRD